MRRQISLMLSTAFPSNQIGLAIHITEESLFNIESSKPKTRT